MITATVKGVELRLQTAASLFSPRAIDRGTLAMLSCVEFRSDQKILDLGCGYGVVGLVAAGFAPPGQVWLVDKDPLAVRLAKENARLNGAPEVNVALSDGFDGLDEAGFDLILCNPPYQADFAVPKRFIEKGFNRLAIGGRMLMVTKRELWYRNKLTAIFGGVTVHHVDDYLVFEAVSRRSGYANRAPKADAASPPSPGARR
ncbi:MAG TPA: methyltransferase [Caulobacteraceae bacterium]